MSKKDMIERNKEEFITYDAMPDFSRTKPLNISVELVEAIEKLKNGEIEAIGINDGSYNTWKSRAIKLNIVVVKRGDSLYLVRSG